MVKPAKWLDFLALIFSLIILGGAVALTMHSGLFATSLNEDTKLSWHLVRSAGIVSYILLTASMAWGLLVSSQLWKDWSPGSLSMMLHATVSWLAVILGLIHGLLLMLDDYFTYTLGDVLVPFTGPYRPVFVGLGTLAFWIGLVVTLSFPVRKIIGRRAWLWIHMASYMSFGLVTFHGVMAGTDNQLPGFQIMMAASVFAVISLLVLRLVRRRAPEKPRRAIRSETVNSTV